MTDYKKLSSLLFCLCIGSCFVSISYAQQYVPFRPIQQRIIGNRVIQWQPSQGQIIQGPIIQGQPVQGQVIQGPITQGAIIQGQPIQGTIIQDQSVQGQIFQPPTASPVAPEQPAPGQNESSIKVLEAAKAKIAELSKEIDELQNANSKLAAFKETNSSLMEANAELKDEYEKLKNDYDQVSVQIAEFQKGSMKSADEQRDQNAIQQQRFDELETKHQTLISQNETLSSQAKALTQENNDLKNRIKSVGENQNDMSGLEANLQSATSGIAALQTQNDAFVAKNKMLSQLNDELTKENQQLQTDVEAIRDESNKLRMQYETASEENVTLGGRVAELSTENESHLSSISSLRSDLSKKPKVAKPVYQPSNDGDDAELAFENSQIIEFNEDLESENALLVRQVSQLQGEVDQLNRSAKSTASPIAALAPAVTSSEGSGKYNVMSWVIPFLLIGLGVGLYTFFMEEYKGDRKTGSNGEAIGH